MESFAEELALSDSTVRLDAIRDDWRHVLTDHLRSGQRLIPGDVVAAADCADLGTVRSVDHDHEAAAVRFSSDDEPPVDVDLAFDELTVVVMRYDLRSGEDATVDGRGDPWATTLLDYLNTVEAARAERADDWPPPRPARSGLTSCPPTSEPTSPTTATVGTSPTKCRRSARSQRSVAAPNTFSTNNSTTGSDRPETSPNSQLAEPLAALRQRMQCSRRRWPDAATPSSPPCTKRSGRRRGRTSCWDALPGRPRRYELRTNVTRSPRWRSTGSGSWSAVTASD